MQSLSTRLRSPAKAVRLGLNAGLWGEVVGDWPVVAGHGERGGVDLLEEQARARAMRRARGSGMPSSMAATAADMPLSYHCY
jgi:hypothetical protein